MELDDWGGFGRAEEEEELWSEFIMWNNYFKYKKKQRKKAALRVESWLNS